jgi:hypothetical protein
MLVRQWLAESQLIFKQVAPQKKIQNWPKLSAHNTCLCFHAKMGSQVTLRSKKETLSRSSATVFLTGLLQTAFLKTIEISEGEITLPRQHQIQQMLLESVRYWQSGSFNCISKGAGSHWGREQINQQYCFSCTQI